MIGKYPYFIYPCVTALKECSDETEAEKLRRIIAANVGDIPALRLMLGMDPEEFARFYPDMLPATLSTSDTIDTFLSRFGQPDAPVSRATAEIGTDYVAALADMPEADTTPHDSTSSAIDSFLSAMEHERHAPAAGKNINKPEKTLPTEADARFCIKNRDYQKALEIIMRLRLNNPEKSIYFADQIRFLRKLILNQAKQNNYNS